MSFLSHSELKRFTKIEEDIRFYYTFIFYSLGILDSGIDAIITQVVNPKIKPLILPYVEDTVYAFLQIDKPKREKQGQCART